MFSYRDLEGDLVEIKFDFGGKERTDVVTKSFFESIYDREKNDFKEEFIDMLDNTVKDIKSIALLMLFSERHGVNLEDTVKEMSLIVMRKFNLSVEIFILMLEAAIKIESGAKPSDFGGGMHEYIILVCVVIATIIVVGIVFYLFKDKDEEKALKRNWKDLYNSRLK